MPQESDGGRKKGFWGSINSVFWQIMSYSFWWICNLPLPMSCCDHSIYILTVSLSLVLVHLILSCLVWTEIECMLHVALHKQPINRFEIVQQSRQEVLRAYYFNKHTVAVVQKSEVPEGHKFRALRADVRSRRFTSMRCNALHRSLY